MNQPYPRSFWLDEALALDPTGPSPELTADTRADVCIVGGGYTGLWTALALKDAEPSLDVVLLERDVCAAGASGRNAGFLMSWWSKFLSLEKLFGEAEALSIARASDEAVSKVVQFCADHGIDADLRQGGWLWAATNQAQIGRWHETIDAIGRHGLTPIVTWSRDETQNRSASKGNLAGAYEARVVRTQPALLARGLRRVAIERGVRIYEKSPLDSIDLANPAVVRTPRASVTAERVVLAMNAWAARWGIVRKAIAVVSGDMIVTPPIPEKLAQMGLSDGLMVTDGSALIEYYRATRDGRLAFGKGGMSGRFCYGGSVGGQVEGASTMQDYLQGAMHAMFPTLDRVRAEKSWRGPIDRSKSGLPFFWHLGKRRNVFFAAGFSGNGLGPSRLAGKILSALALERQDEWSRCPLVREPARDFPPEPFRYIGSKLVARALQATDTAEDEGREPPFAARLLARLAPAGLSPFKPPDETAGGATATGKVVANPPPESAGARR